MVQLKTGIDTLRQGWQTSSVKGQKVNILHFVGYMISVTSTQLGGFNAKAILCSYKTLFTKTGRRPKLANSCFKGKLSSVEILNVQNILF